MEERHDWKYYTPWKQGCMETHISNNMFQGNTLNKPVGAVSHARPLAEIATVKAAKVRKKSRRLNTALLSSHVAVVVGIVGIIAFGYKAPVEASPSLAAQTVMEQDATVDQIAAATVASSVAQTLDLAVQDNVQNLAVSLNAKTDLAQTDSNLVTKPQIVEQNSGRKGIATYATQDGDTVQSVAAKFGVSEDTIRWANNLTVDVIGGGKQILIPGTTGAIHKVADGDTLESIASRYSADGDRIITYNDLELSGLVVGATIVIPDGVLPATQRPGYVAPATYNSGVAVSSVRATVYGGNGYAYGYCTWWAFNRRAEMGRPIGSNWGNAVTWSAYARAAGVQVDKNPAVGAVIQNGGGWGGLGHVGVVERVNADGSLYVSDMNYAGWNVVSYRTIPASQVGSFWYIH